LKAASSLLTLRFMALKLARRGQSALVVAALAVVVSFPCAAFSQTPIQSATLCSEASLPAPIDEALRTSFAGWRWLQVSDLDGDDPKLWLEEHPKECPGVAMGHFEAPNRVSYALLLVPNAQHGAVGPWQLVIFGPGSNSVQFISKRLERCEGKGCFAPVIYKEKPGKYVGFDETKSVHLRLDGIGVEFLEKSSYIYYWWQGRYHKIDTSD